MKKYKIISAYFYLYLHFIIIFTIYMYTIQKLIIIQNPLKRLSTTILFALSVVAYKCNFQLLLPDIYFLYLAG